MANFFFLSFDNLIINHVKISIKFDKFNLGKARMSLRFILTSSEIHNDSKLYLLIKNNENPVTLKEISSDYNKHLSTEEFRQVAGAYGLEPKRDLEHSAIFTIEKFPENKKIQKRTAIHPKEITCERVEYRDTPKQLENEISKRDILLRIRVKDITKILQEASIDPKKPYVWIFQFRFFLEHFIPEEALECWRSSSTSWSVDFDIHKQRGFENLVKSLEEKKVLRYPDSLELWVTIPHLHQLVGSSPVYEKAFRLKSEDIAYKTEKQQIGEFETQKGDYAVKIMNKMKKFIEFSIICASPFLQGEQPQELREKIESLREDFKIDIKSLRDYFKESLRDTTEKFVTWKELITPLTLLVTLLSLIVSSTVALVIRMGGYNENIIAPSGEMNLGLLVLSTVFTGTVVWAIAFSLSFVSRKYLLYKRSSTGGKREILLFPRSLAWAIILVMLVLYTLVTVLLYLSNK